MFEGWLERAFAADAANQPAEAFRCYAEAIKLLTESIGGCQVPGQRIQLLRLANNCLERMTAMAEQQPGSLGSLELNDALRSSHDRTDYLSSAAASNSHSSSRPASPLSHPPGGTVEMSLAGLRKAHEQQLIAQRPPLRLSIGTGNAMSSSGLVAKSSRSEALVASLLERRQQTSAKLNDFLSHLGSKARELQADLRTRLEEESWRRSLRSYPLQNVTLVEPVLALMSKPAHPIGELTRDLLARERSQLLLSQGSELARTVKTVFAELDAFGEQLAGLLRHNYPELADCPPLALKLTGQHSLLSTALGPLLLDCLYRVQADRDAQFREQCMTLGWEDLFPRLHLRPRHRLGSKADCFPLRAGEGPYQRAMEELRLLPTQLTPYAKLGCLSRACSALCVEVEEWHRAQTLLADDTHPTVEMALGSEDLVGLLAYSLVRSHLAHLPSEFEYITALIPEEMVRGEAGYLLATLQAAMELIQHQQ